MTRSLSIGGCTYDLFIQTQHLQTEVRNNEEFFCIRTGDKIPISGITETCGGGANNTSVGLSRLGLASHYCGVIASDQWGQYLLQNFTNERVNTTGVTIVENEVSSFSLILSSQSGERTILYTPGSNTHMHDALFPVEQCETMDWIYYNHIPEKTCIIHDDVTRIVSMHHKKITWNPGGYLLTLGYKDSLIAPLLAHTTILQLNKEEAMRFTGTNNKFDALRLLLQSGVEIVCITDGIHGTIASDGQKIYTCAIIESNTIDTTGAGDAFGVGVTWAISQNLDLPIALKAGSINAASVVQYIGAQAGLLTDIEMRHALKHTNVQVVEETL